MGNQVDLEHRTREQLFQELDDLRHRIAELEAAETERNQVEQALRQSEKQFRIIADFTHDWEYWIDPAGNYIYVSPSCERITGYSADDFLAAPHLLEKIIHPQDRTAFAQHTCKESKQNAELSTEFRIITSTGETRWIHHVCQPVYDDGSEAGRRASNRASPSAFRQKRRCANGTANWRC
ncbi:MAG TPA: PAS domain S-box protein [Chloroflexi bacterium]|nr:PAS domain S-box protein [Chloroflexota bacterium]